MHKKLRSLLTASAVAIAASLALPAHAALTTFFAFGPAADKVVGGPPAAERTRFEAELDMSTVSREDFSRFTAGPLVDDEGQPVPLRGLFTGNNATGGTLTPEGEAFVEATNGNFGRFNTTCAVDTACDGQWFETSADFTLQFGRGVAAFGFYGTDAGDFDGSLEIELLGRDGSAIAGGLLEVIVGGAADSDLFFFGVQSTTDLIFGAKFVVAQSGEVGNDFFGFDDLVIGNLRSIEPPPNGTPEPATLALVGASLLGLAASRRRRARSA